MKDINAIEGIEIQIRQDGKVLWVNVDGICELRVFTDKKIEIEDNREYVLKETEDQGESVLGFTKGKENE